MDNSEYYYAIIGDIISSRSEPNRAEIQRTLNRALNKINSQFSDSIAAKFLITLGDEFQGLLYSKAAGNPLKIALMISDMLHPVKLRIGIGYGNISTDIDSSYAIGADGEAFHNARACIDRIRANEKRNSNHEFCARILIKTYDSSFDSGINTILMLSETLEKTRTMRQEEIFRCYFRSLLYDEKLTQSQIADNLGITQSTLNLSLTASNTREYIQGINTAFRLLDEFK